MVNNKVSVIIPIYNAEKYLSNTFNCLLDQDYQYYEVLAVNDCSTDNSARIIAEYKDLFIKSNVNFIFIDREKNGGLCTAINSGVENSSGDYLCFPDADDDISPDYISSMVETLENVSNKWVRCNYTLVLDEENREYDIDLPAKSCYKNDFYDFVSKYIPHNAWNMMIEKSYFLSCIGSQIYNSRLTQEWSLLLPLSYYSDYARCDKILYRYHVRKNAMSSWLNGDLSSVIEHFNALEELNVTIIDFLENVDNDSISVSKRAINIYYHLMRYKQYTKAQNEVLAKKEINEMLKKTSSIICKKLYYTIDDADLYVRFVFDKLLEADMHNNIINFDKYKKICEKGYVVLYDKPGIRLVTALISAFGKPVSVISCSELVPSQWSGIPKMCLIENSDIYKKTVEKDISSSEQYFDFRDIRNSLRGWASREMTF